MRGVVGADLPFEEHVVRAWRRGDIFRVRGILHVAARRHGGVEGDELDARLLTSVQRRVDRHRVNGADMKQADMREQSSPYFRLTRRVVPMLARGNSLEVGLTRGLEEHA